jgi:Sortilin, neurotensin receptor 3,
MNLKQVHMPKDAILSASFTLMDTSEEQVFLYLENHGLKSPFGNLYISDANARVFSLSMENAIKGEAVDFERVTSLDGTFLANRYDDGHTHDPAFNKKFFGQDEFTEADMIAEETRKGKMSRMPANNESKKQEETKRQVFKIEDSVPASEVQENVRSFITHNKGGRWELIRAPTDARIEVNKKSTECFIEDGCSLHLEIYSHGGKLAPVYSTEKAVGLVLGTGNIGRRLTENNNLKNLYLSRDGGLTWKTAKNGVFIYEIGDHGGLIAIAKKNVATDEIEISWDQGDTWEKIRISDEKLFIENIIIEPNSVS